jgi:nicotinamide-nucleotide amidase
VVSASTVPDELAADVVAALLQAGRTLATGESLTAGLVSSTIATVPGCSAVLRGGVVAYHADVKADLLGVPADVLVSGVVSEQVALGMARGAAATLRADIGIGTTGVAGPDDHDGQPAGTVWIAAWSADAQVARRLALSGDRDAIRRQTVVAALRLVTELLDESGVRAG